MTSEQLDSRLRASDPLGRAPSAEDTLGGALSELRREIVVAEPVQAAPRTAAAWRPFRIRPLILAGSLLLIAAVALVVGLRPGEESTGTAYAAEAVKVAEANPRLLLGDPDWRVSYAQWDSPSYGEIEFTPRAGGLSRGHLDMSWMPINEWRGRARDWIRATTGSPETGKVDGVEAQVYAVAGDPHMFIGVMPPQGDLGVLFRGTASDEQGFVDRLASLEATDVDTWLAAMPPSVVLPDYAEDRLSRVLEGVSLPADTESSGLSPASMPQSEAQFDAYVLRGAFCSWLDEWWAADQQGDDGAAAAAIAELLRAPEWPALQQGPEAATLRADFRQYAQTVAEGNGSKKVYDQMENCVEYP